MCIFIDKDFGINVFYFVGLPFIAAWQSSFIWTSVQFPWKACGELCCHKNGYLKAHLQPHVIVALKNYCLTATYKCSILTFNVVLTLFMLYKKRSLGSSITFGS